ncbi:MAG: TatD family hydrolase [Candidatus Pacebacteria bacterium]|jgi:TatD DNase family protein|nr:TatD family hydrolase [Candidatus Paceibacterota bacterium]
MQYIDVHSHLNLPEFKDDLASVIARLRAHEIATIVVGVDRETSQLAVELALRYENIYASVGQHPVDNKDEMFDPMFYEKLVARGKVVAIGECGLDYFRLKEESAIEKIRQRELFAKQIELACTLDLPLMLHARPTKDTMDAYEDVLAILASYSSLYTSKLRGNVHFFVGDVSIAERFLALGFTMSFTGVVTFTTEYDAVIAQLPLTAILAETDAPFAAPVPHRGKRSEPEHVALVIEHIAKVRQEKLEVVKQALVTNAERVFGLKKG